MSSSAEQIEKIAEFQGITGASDVEARSFLEAHNWDLHSAIVMFFDTADVGNPNQPEQQHQLPIPQPQPLAQQESRPIFGSSVPGNEDDDDDQPWQPMVPPMQSSGAASRPGRSRPPQRGFATLGDYQDSRPTDNDDDENRQTLFAGGEKSGISIENPGQPNPLQDDIQNILRTAAQNAQMMTPPPQPSQPRFTGTGYTLGSDTQPSQPIVPAGQAQSDAIDRELTLWRNGFSLDDGRFFPFSDPSTAELLRQIRNGEVPRRLVNAGFGQEVRLKVSRRENEDFSPQTTAGRSAAGGGSFFGQGTRLGSAVPGEPVIPQPPPSMPQPASRSQPDTSTDLKPEIDPSQPQTTIQIRLADGTRLVAQFNLSSTMESVYSFLSNARPTDGREFVLQTIFPTRVLERSAKTIEEEGLKNGTVVMRWKS